MWSASTIPTSPRPEWGTIAVDDHLLRDVLAGTGLTISMVLRGGTGLNTGPLPQLPCQAAIRGEVAVGCRHRHGFGPIG